MKRKISADHVADFLMDEFIKKKFKPGEKIIETQIAEKTNVSQTVVRETINILISKGFLERIPFKGTKFKNFTIKEVIDYQKVRASLEILAIKISKEELFYNNINLEYLQEMINNMIACSSNNDYKGRTYFNYKFHKHIVEAGNNNSLLAAWEALGHYYWAYVWLYLNAEILYKRTINHQEILEALSIKDRPKLIFLIKKHFSDLVKLLSKEELKV